jgi:hypothetical protein
MRPQLLIQAKMLAFIKRDKYHPCSAGLGHIQLIFAILTFGLSIPPQLADVVFY